MQQKRLERRRKFLQRSYWLLLQRQRERKGRSGIRWLLMSICSREPSLQVLNYLGGAGRFSLEDVSADRWLMSGIRSHSFFCLHVCVTLTSWHCRWTWHPLLFQGDVMDGEAELIVLSLCVGLFQAINFSLLFYKLHSGYTGRVRSLYMSPEEHKVPLDDKCPTLMYTPWLLRSG